MIKQRNVMTSMLIAALIAFLTFGSKDTIAEIIDNGTGNQGHSGWVTRGAWYPSNGKLSYGTQSEYSKQPGAKYEYWDYSRDTDPSGYTGPLDVYLWWTEANSRCTEVEVEIYGSDFAGMELHSTETVNQQHDGGKWNYLGTYYTGGVIEAHVVSSGKNGCSTSADAIKVVNTGTVEPPEDSTQCEELILKLQNLLNQMQALLPK